MRHEVQQETELRRYLLGELPLEEQVLVEQRLFLDSDYAELLQSVENNLVDEYLDEKFKDDPIIPPVPFFSRPFVWLSLSVAALILFSIVAWLVFRAARGPSAEAPMQANDPVNTRPDERQTTPLPKNDNRVETADKGNTNESRPTPAPENSNKPPERQYLATKIEPYTLSAGDVGRSTGSIKKVAIHDDTKEVRLTLPLEFSESYEKYRAELMRGPRKINQWILTAQSGDSSIPSVVVPIPAEVLTEQRYRIKLYGIPAENQSAEPASVYHFAVERK